MKMRMRKGQSIVLIEAVSLGQGGLAERKLEGEVTAGGAGGEFKLKGAYKT